VIALVDYGAGNLTSVRKALAFVGAEVWTPAHPSELARARAVIVPGVGHFARLRPSMKPWREAIRAALARSAPLLGICVGLQWLFEGSTEAPGVPGLGVIPGVCTRLGADAQLGSRRRLRHGFGGQARLPADSEGAACRLELLAFPRPTRLFDGIPEGTQVYFTHSYAAPVVPATAPSPLTVCRSRPRSRTASSRACSSTPRSPATPG
jgi:imidazole glycerol-phosphate synthase subunit HisH